jgi:heat shock protein HslJ
MKTNFFLISLAVLVIGCKNGQDKKTSNTIKDSTAPTTENSDTVPDPAHNSRNSLDYHGTYSGIIPCADCEGILTEIQLFKDGSFSKTVQYLGKEDEGRTEKGNYTWNTEGSGISIPSSGNETQLYKVGENVLFHLDKEGNRIEGDLVENYKLTKASETQEIENKKWVLTELLGKRIEPDNSATQAFILFNSEMSRISGNNSCNTFNGPYELKGPGQISLGNLAVTQRACMDMATAASFNEVLNKVDNYTIVEDILNLNKAKMATLAKFKRVEVRN